MKTLVAIALYILLVVIDPHRRQIDRAALWQAQNRSFDYDGCSPRWRGNEIIMPVNDAKQISFQFPFA